MVADYAGRLGKAAAAAERVLELLQRIPEVRDAPVDLASIRKFNGCWTSF